MAYFEADKPPEIKPRHRSLFPKALGKSLEPLLKPLYKQQGFGEHRLLTEWAQIVGADMASYSVPQKITFSRSKISEGNLHIQVAGGRALEMQYRLPELMDRINTYFGYRAIGAIKFLPAPQPPAAAKTNPSSRNTTLPDPAFTALAEQCDDDALREALLSLSATLRAVEK